MDDVPHAGIGHNGPPDDGRSCPDDQQVWRIRDWCETSSFSRGWLFKFRRGPDADLLEVVEDGGAVRILTSPKTLLRRLAARRAEEAARGEAKPRHPKAAGPGRPRRKPRVGDGARDADGGDHPPLSDGDG